MFGCSPKKQPFDMSHAKSKPVNLTNGKDVEFPEFLVGTWKADEYNWLFKFEPDGSISKLVHLLWALEINMNEGGYAIEGPDEGTYAFFMMGPCETSYDSSSRELKVSILMDRYEMKLPGGTLSGKSEDHFSGTISEDGLTWYTKWRNYGYLDGADDPDIEYINTNPVPLTFTKIDTSHSNAQ